jgi:hypothetical protein
MKKIDTCYKNQEKLLMPKPNKTFKNQQLRGIQSAAPENGHSLEFSRCIKSKTEFSIIAKLLTKNMFF